MNHKDVQHVLAPNFLGVAQRQHHNVSGVTFQQMEDRMKALQAHYPMVFPKVRCRYPADISGTLIVVYSARDGEV